VDLAGHRILDELWQVQPNPDFARTRDIRHPRVGDLLRLGARHRREQSDYREQAAETLLHGGSFFDIRQATGLTTPTIHVLVLGGKRPRALTAHKSRWRNLEFISLFV
jgi:hypothetical protein